MLAATVLASLAAAGGGGGPGPDGRRAYVLLSRNSGVTVFGGGLFRMVWRAADGSVVRTIGPRP